MKRNNRVIPFKNYIILIFVLFGTCLLAYYFYLWYLEYRSDRLGKPIMNEYLLQIYENELDNYITENKDVVVYASLVGENRTRKFENSFKNIINKYQLRDSIIYLNMSDIKINKFASKYNIKLDDKLPVILIFKNGIYSSMYSIGENNYSVDRVENYLKYSDIIEVL